MLQAQRLEPLSFNIQTDPEFYKTVESTILTLFPNAQFSGGRNITIHSQVSKEGIRTEVILADSTVRWEIFDQEISDSGYTVADWKRRRKERIRLGLIQVLTQEYQLKPSPWGILVGVRPTKLIHSFFDRGFSLEKIKYLLSEVYGLESSRQGLLLEVVSKQRLYFHEQVHNPIGIYIGVPFCPTRCKYCSFAAYPLASHGHLVDGFINALYHEIEEIGCLLQELGIMIESVYVGGGTPTIIRGNRLIKLLALLNKYFAVSQSREFTVEAGRPETLDLETCQILQQAGVHRISINPQTMNDQTLVRIGRDHTSAQVRQAFEYAKTAGITTINADLIIGLPGETLSDLEHTLTEVGKLEPDNITVHSLAMKRAAEWRKSTLEQLYQEQALGESMSQLTQDYVRSLGLEPYYLYRQRKIFSDLENIGYAKPGTESVYNIQMMEERQSIVSLGGGAISKFVKADLSLLRHANPKCPATYSQQIEEIIAAKKCLIRQYLVV
ncbi:MAG: coproporphyrinogen dehydrogenase HemZ [Firmicutes bacterium]|nr:coproporphyrinogen dehydrogenase HemZ [Bacillota bacterium]